MEQLNHAVANQAEISLAGAKAALFLTEEECGALQAARRVLTRLAKACHDTRQGDSEAYFDNLWDDLWDVEKALSGDRI